MNTLPIIKIIEGGVGYADKTYQVGEVLELDHSIAEGLLKDGIAVEATKKELQKWESYLLGEVIRKKANAEKSERMKRFSLKLDNYIGNAEAFFNYNSFFYDSVGIFWFWDDSEKKYIQKDEVDVMDLFDNIIGLDGQTVGSGIKNNYLEAFKRVGRKNTPKEAPIKWVQFKGKAYSLSSGLLYNVNSDFFFTNPIPYKLGNTTKTPTMDKLFTEWVGKDKVKTLYEIIAYCCYRSYPIQVLFCLYGAGRNGKTCFIRLIDRFLGQSNRTSTELDTLLDSRFESFKLYRKLLCMMGETNFGVISRTSLLKKLVGGDVIGYEKKGKDPFDDYNYAKIVIASNSLPSSTDTSEGFYRRWLIVDFPNQFPEGKDILETVPEQEYNNLALKVTRILPKLLESGTFTNQGDIEERKMRYILASNPLPIFIKVCCTKGEDIFASYNELYTAYLKYLKFHKKRRVRMKEFRSSLEDEGVWVERTSKSIDGDYKSGNWVEGLRLIDNWELQIYDNENSVVLQ